MMLMETTSRLRLKSVFHLGGGGGGGCPGVSRILKSQVYTGTTELCL